MLQGFKTPLVGLCAMGTYFSLIIFQGHESVIVGIVIALGILMLLINWSFEHLVVYVALLVIGIFTELLSVHVGLWEYPGTMHAWGVPLYIPFIWSNGTLFVIEMKEAIDEFIEKYT